MAEEYNNSNPLTMKKLAVRMDELESIIGGGHRPQKDDSERILAELSKIAAAEEEANRRRRTMTATHVTRIAIEVLVIIALCAFAIGCTNEIPGFLPKPETGNNDSIIVPEVEVPVKPGDNNKPDAGNGGNEIIQPDNGNGNGNDNGDDNQPAKSLDSTVWTCEPTSVEGMDVIRVEFDENGAGGNVVFVTRGRERTRSFSLENGNMLLRAPESIWSITTDYSTKLTLVTEDGEMVVLTRSSSATAE